MHNKRVVGVGNTHPRKSPDTLLGFETTSPRCLLVGVGAGRRSLVGGGRFLLLPCFWWWGVVFDLWIVVASISQ